MMSHLASNGLQESLPELIGEFDKSMHKVSRRSMELASMKELSRAALDQEQSAVGELEEHLKYVGVSMRTHLHSIFVEVNRWPGLIQRLLVHKATQDVLQDEQCDTAADIDSFPAQFVTAGELHCCAFCSCSFRIRAQTNSLTLHIVLAVHVWCTSFVRYRQSVTTGALEGLVCLQTRMTYHSPSNF